MAAFAMISGPMTLVWTYCNRLTLLNHEQAKTRSHLGSPMKVIPLPSLKKIKLWPLSKVVTKMATNLMLSNIRKGIRTSVIKLNCPNVPNEKM